MESKDINPVERLHNDIRDAHDHDCTDQLMDCTSECDINDKDCETSCIDEYHDCVIPQDHHSPIPGTDVSDFYHGILSL
tara:strand:- start:359 stop:595 length:237 start_codon:yes stop_codon:yes gene_type:complete